MEQQRNQSNKLPRPKLYPLSRLKGLAQFCEDPCHLLYENKRFVEAVSGKGVGFLMDEQGRINRLDESLGVVVVDEVGYEALNFGGWLIAIQFNEGELD